MKRKERAFSSADHVFASTRSMRSVFYCLGLLPFFYRKADGGYGYRWRRWQPLMAAHVLLAALFAAYSSYADWIAYIPGAQRLEQMAFAGIVLCLLLGLFANVACLLLRAPRWPPFFRRWARVDGLLDIRRDPRMRSLSRALLAGFGAYVLFLLAIACCSGLLLLLQPQTLAMGPTYPFTLAIYAFHFSVCLILPELFCAFTCAAICSRLRALCGQLVAAGLAERLGACRRSRMERLSVGRVDLSCEVERWRVAYQLLMDSVGHVNRTFGPFLLTTCVLHVLPLPLLVYSFVKQGETGVTVKIIKVTAFVTDFVRVAVMCLVGQRVHDQSREVYAILQDAPSNKLSKSTNQEIIFFMNCIRLSSSKISAWGFLHVDTGYLQSVVGVMVAYTVTIMQFEMTTCPTSSSLSPLPANIINYNNCSFNFSPNANL